MLHSKKFQTTLILAFEANSDFHNFGLTIYRTSALFASKPKINVVWNFFERRVQPHWNIFWHFQVRPKSWKSVGTSFKCTHEFRRKVWLVFESILKKKYVLLYPIWPPNSKKTFFILDNWAQFNCDDVLGALKLKKKMQFQKC